MVDTLEDRVQETVSEGDSVWFRADGRSFEGRVDEVDVGAGHGVQTDVYVSPTDTDEERYALTFRDNDTPRVSYGELGDDGEYYWEGLGNATAYDV